MPSELICSFVALRCIFQATWSWGEEGTGGQRGGQADDLDMTSRFGSDGPHHGTVCDVLCGTWQRQDWPLPVEWSFWCGAGEVGPRLGYKQIVLPGSLVSETQQGLGIPSWGVVKAAQPQGP